MSHDEFENHSILLGSRIRMQILTCLSFIILNYGNRYLSSLSRCGSCFWIRQWYEWYRECDCSCYLLSFASTKKISSYRSISQFPLSDVRWYRRCYEHPPPSSGEWNPEFPDANRYISGYLYSSFFDYLGSRCLVVCTSGVEFTCPDWFDYRGERCFFSDEFRCWCCHSLE